LGLAISIVTIYGISLTNQFVLLNENDYHLKHKAENQLIKEGNPHMVTAAKATSQVGLHMAVAFGVMYAVTGSAAFGGIAAILEPIINVLLLPLHDKVWARIRQRMEAKRAEASSKSGGDSPQTA
jgi:uncharacterized membrane protein